MTKCSLCHQYNMHEFMFKQIDPIDPTIRVCLSCSTLIKKYGKIKALELLSNTKRRDNKQKSWRK
jgi:hypothetical protein